jgi:RND family efflux transporter MFP subunit
MSDAPDILRFTPPKRLKTAGILAAGVAVAVVAFGLVGRSLAARQTEDWTRAEAVPVVQTINLAARAQAPSLVLPGAVQAFNSAPIYAQVTGYVLKWYVDIGAPVKAGQLLAEIDPRSYQASLDQASGAFARDSANLAEARLDLGRYQALAAQNAISSQQLSVQKTTVAADSGGVAADKANMDTARINLGYTRIVAPFDGTITSRSIDIGNYVAAGNGSGTPLFTVSDKSKLRIYVHVPQSYSAEVMPGMTAAFTVPEYPGRVFTATVQASSNSVDTATGSVLVQLQADNGSGALKPGDYAQVHFDLLGNPSALQVPSSALMFRDSGMAVATVEAGDRVAIKRVAIAHDFGSTVEIAYGLGRQDRVINNPPDSLRSGDHVQVTNAGPVRGAPKGH